MQVQKATTTSIKVFVFTWQHFSHVLSGSRYECCKGDKGHKEGGELLTYLYLLVSTYWTNSMNYLLFLFQTGAALLPTVAAIAWRLDFRGF